MLRLLLLLLLTSGAVRAQNAPAPAFTFNHLALPVKDVDRSTAFYTKTLQLQEITNRTKLAGVRWLSLGEGKELHLVALMKTPVTVNKGIHLALATARFDAFLQGLDAWQVPYSDWPGTAHTVNRRADGVRQVYFQDPDGYWIEIDDVGR